MLAFTRDQVVHNVKGRSQQDLDFLLDCKANTNNYAKWFHVAEHESNHDGQIKFLKNGLPGAKAE